MTIHTNGLRFIRLAAAAFLCFTHLACGKKKAAVTGIAGDYDLSNPAKFNMPDGLLEISGIAFHNGNPDTIYAEQDEKGRLYRFLPGNQKAWYSSFRKDGDYEDIAILKDQVFILRSDGVLFSFALNQAWSEKAENVREYNELVPKGEYEGLYADDKEEKLYMLCKNCKEKGVSGYIINAEADTLVKLNGSFTIDLSALSVAGGKKKVKFRPSAITRHPASGDWYILSSVNKMLLVTDAAFKLKSTFSLKSGLFLQPEGIAFDKDLNLYISNEGDEISAGNVLKFRPRK